MPKDEMTSNKKLIQAIKNSGIKQRELAVRAGVSQSAISNYVKGEYSPRPKVEAAIVSALGLPDGYLDSDSEADSGPQLRCKTSLSVAEAADLMGKSKAFVYMGLQRGELPIGCAIKIGKQWSYYISAKKFADFTGIAL